MSQCKSTHELIFLPLAGERRKLGASYVRRC